MSDDAAEIRKIQAQIRKERGLDTPQGEFSSAWDSFKSGVKSVGQGALGVVTGVGEAMNPLAIPHGVETLTRAPFQDVDPNQGMLGRISERFSEASGSSVTNPMRVETVAPIGRSLVRKGIGEAQELLGGEESPSLVDLYDQEVASQKSFNKDVGETSRAVGEIGTGLLSLAQLGVQGAKQIPKVVNKAKSFLQGAKPAITNLDNTIEGLGSVARKGPQKILREMTGPLPERIEGAIINRTSKIRGLLKDPGSQTKIYDSVLKMRENFDDTEKLLTGSLREFRRALASNKETSFDSQPVLDMLKDFVGGQRLSGGKSTLEGSDVALIDRYRSMLSNPAKVGRKVQDTNQVSVGDVVKIMDDLDDKLQPFYNGTDRSPKMKLLSEVRQTLDAGLADMYPAYKESKVLFKNFKDSTDMIRKRIDSTGAESFLSNLFGQNKTELQLAVESSLNQAEEAAKSLKNLTPEIATGFKQADASGLKAIENIKKLANEVKAPKAQAFLDDLADQIAARRLKSFTDKDADEYIRLVNQYVKPRADLAQGASTALLGFFGNKLAGPSGGVIIGYGGGKAVRGLSEAALTNIAKNRYDIMNVLTRIEGAKTAPSRVRSIAKDAKKIADKFGDGTVIKFLDAVNLSRKEADAIAKLTAAMNLVPDEKK